MDIFEIYKKLKRNGDWARLEQLKQTRKFIYNMTQVEFADLLGISYNTYISWECGRYTPSTPSQALLHVATYHKDIFLEDRKRVLEKVGELEL